MILLTLFLEFFKIGLFSFGGAFGMLPLIKETVLLHEWMDEELFYDLIGVCESTPGPIAVNMATFIGSTQAGLWGSIFATLGVILPSFLIILLIAALLKNLTKNEWFRSAIGGIAPVIVGLILSTGTLLLLRALKLTTLVQTGLDFISLTILAILTAIYFVFKFVFKKKISTIPLILLSVLLGIVVSLLFQL